MSVRFGSMARRSGLIAGLGAVALIGALAVPGRTPAAAAKPPIKIGISVSLTGDFSGDGQAVEQGYKLWASDVNKSGGLLGRKISLDFVNDGSSTTQVTTNYQKLITVDKVDLVFGGFSSLLTIPAATVANRYHYAFPEPAGGGPKVFAAKLPNLVFVQPAPVVDNVVSFTRWILRLPANQRPKTAAYSTEDDPFAQPQINVARGLLEKGGIKTVYNTVFPGETTDYAPLALAIAHKKPDIVVLGTTGLPEAVGFIQTFIQQHYNPKALVETSGPDQGKQFSSKIGVLNTTGIIVPSGWWPGAKTFYNAKFVDHFIKTFHVHIADISADSAEAYSVGQVVQQAVNHIHSIDNRKLIAALHSGHFKTVQGPISFNSLGEPQGQMFLVQWQNGVAVPVYPPGMAVASPIYPKPGWH